MDTKMMDVLCFPCFFLCILFCFSVTCLDYAKND